MQHVTHACSLSLEDVQLRGGGGCAGVDVLITMLPSAEHVRQVYLGSDGILRSQGQHALLPKPTSLARHDVDSGVLKSQKVPAMLLQNGYIMLTAPFAKRRK